MSTELDPDDETLMERYRDGDAGAFDVLYGRHKGGVFRYMLRQCGDRGVAEELHQDVWMNLIRSRSSYVVQAKFSTYLYRMAHNRLIDHYRSRRGAVAASYDDEAEVESVAAPRGDDPAIALDGRRQVERLMQAVTALPAAQREAFVLQQESDMSVEEIARTTGVSRETAKSRLRYALARLRRDMDLEQ